MIDGILDWIYPPACMGCRTLLPLNDKQRKNILLCASCEALIEPLPAEECERSGDGFHFTRNYSVFAYDGLLRDIIHNIKFRYKKNYACGLGNLWAKKAKTIEADFFIPVPMHPKKQRERGFNQAETLARIMARQLNIPFIDALKRTVDTPPQAGLSPARRIENVKGVFSVRPHCARLINSKVCVLIDDIYTTGASLNECARVLKAQGAGIIICMTLAVTVRKEAN